MTARTPAVMIVALVWAACQRAGIAQAVSHLWFRRLTASLIRFVVRGVLLLCGLFIVLDVMGIIGAVGAFIGALGLLGLAAGILFKDWLANYFPAVLLGMHPPFKTGDLVQIGDHEGRVIKITPRATVLLTMDGEELRLPNTVLIEEPMINYSENRERRLRFVVPLSPRADLGMAQDIGCRALLELRGVKSDPPPFLRTQALHRDAVDAEFFAWVDQDAVNFRTVASRDQVAPVAALVHDAHVAMGIERAPHAPAALPGERQRHLQA